MRYATLHPDGTITDEVEFDPSRCRHLIFDPSHYRLAGGGSCRCDDPEHKEMAEWGYLWSPDLKGWF